MPYFPQDHPAFNGLRHLLLHYGDAARPWSRDQLRYSVAHVDQGGRADDWLFDSFLFLNAKASSGRDYCADVNLGTTMCGEGDFFAMCSPRPGTREDWEELLEFYFSPSGALRTLDATVGDAQREIGRPYGKRRNVVLMMPYPHVTQSAWGALPSTGAALDFSIGRQNLARATEQRLAACTWFLDEIARRRVAPAYEHLHLLGVYWMFETVYRGWDVDDHWLLKSLRARVNAAGLALLWIPFWSSYNLHLLDDYRSYYFDLAFLQPNHMFYKEGRSLEAAAEAARRRGGGIEMEYYLQLDEPIGVPGERHARFREYLNGGVQYGYMRGAACAHFQGVAALERMHSHEDPIERELYEDIYHFVKGDYETKPSVGAGPVRPVAARVAIAVDLGGTHLRAALVDASGRVLEKWSEPTPAGRDAILSRMRALVARVAADAVRRGLTPAGVGVSTGGRVDADRGIVVDATALLEGWQGVPLGADLEASCGLPVRVDNDGQCAALAELRFGAGRGVRDFVAVTVGTGIGGGIVSSGVVLRGACNAAGEVGHVPIQADGPECSCGGRGCVEGYASGSGITARARAMARAGLLDMGRDAERIDAPAIGAAAREGHEGALALVRHAGEALGTAIAGLVNLLNPERVILSGPVLQLGDAYVGAIRATVAGRAMSTARARCEVVISPLDEPALLGAASLVLGE